MSSPLRSFRDFASLERKRRELQKAGDNWRRIMESLAVRGYLEYQKVRNKRQGEAALQPDYARLHDFLSAAVSAERAAPYLPSDLFEVQEELAGKVDSYRASPGRRVAAGHEPIDPQLVAGAVGRFFDWLNSPAFSEMHPVEQMTLCQVRLYEIWPYESGSDLLADLFAVRVLATRTGIVPWPLSDDVPEFYAALSEAFGFATKRLVDFHLKGCERACDETIRRL